MHDVRPGRQGRIGTPLLLALSGGYLALSAAAFLLVQPPGGASTPALWFPPIGLAYGYLLRSGVRGVPVVAVALACGTLLQAAASAQHGGLWRAMAVDAGIATWLAGCALTQRRLWHARPTATDLAWLALFGIALAPVGAAAISTLAAGTSGLASDGWARRVLGDATAVVTLAPAFYLVSEEALTRIRLAPEVTRYRRLAVVGQASVIAVIPALFVLLTAPRPGALSMLPLALAPLCWLAVGRDLTRASIVLAGCALLLGATAEARFGDSLSTFQLQSVMFAAATAALLAGAGLVAEAGAARLEAVQTTRWRALVGVAPAVVARIDRSGRWTTDPDARQPGAQAVVDRAARVPALVRAAAAGSADTVHWRCDEDEGRRFVTHLTPLPDGGCLAVTTETTGLHSAEVALAWERSHDRATDLPNRDLLLATTEHLLGEGTAHAAAGAGPSVHGDGHAGTVTDDAPGGAGACLVLVDVDRAGWRAELLQLDPAQLMLTLAERLRGLLDPRLLADGRALVARIGDDQFGLLVPGDAHTCRELAARMVAALRRPAPTPRGPISVTAWAGVAQLEPGRPARETLHLAATALHTAIERHHQPVVVLDDLSVATTAQRARLVGEVAGAIDRGELEVVFQPDVRLPDGRLSGVEALVRWRRPEGFATATDLFVRLAEEAGAVQAVDAWVMEESLGRLGAWLHEHPDCDLELALNISPLSLTEDLPDRLFEACLRHDVPPWHLRLEVTESALADDSTAPGVLRRLRSRGCRVALDDFGTGYASLSRLHRLPVDVVKLDRSFLSPITEDEAGRSLVSLVLGLAGPLRVEVVVEGVETPQQRDLLIDLGCRRAQGFLFARPCRPEMIDELLASGLPLGGLSATAPAPSGPGRTSGGVWAGPADGPAVWLRSASVTAGPGGLPAIRPPSPRKVRAAAGH
ncbi:MAG TPA: EAL domain-containing protein [Kineosporiaceae bacterium]|nr:EAL domain-containing protein [Kineosporiaceae bacterium]